MGDTKTHGSVLYGLENPLMSDLLRRDIENMSECEEAAVVAQVSKIITPAYRGMEYMAL